MTSVVYAMILAVLICWTALQVVKARRANQVRYADGGVDELIIARSAHSNLCEYAPIFLILLMCAEYNGTPVVLIHLLGVLFCYGRIMHVISILRDKLKRRILGMQLTLAGIVLAILCNIVFFPFEKLF